MLIKSEHLATSKAIRDHRFPTTNADGMAESVVSDDGEAPPLTVDDCLQTIEHLEKTVERVKQQRYQEGFEAGEKAGYAQGIETIGTHIDRIVDALDALSGQQEAVAANAEQFVVDFALKIVEKILDDEMLAKFKLPRTKLDQIVGEALNLFADSTKFIIRLHKDTGEVLEQYKPEITKQLSRPIALSIVEDPSLRPCDCMIESEHGVLDARIDSQLKEIKSVFQTR